MMAGFSVLLPAAPLVGHHAFSAEFDANKPVQLRGVVTKMEWITPHAWIHIDVKRPNGKVEKWMIEGGSPQSLIRRGFNKNSLPVGTEILVDGYQSKDGTTKGQRPGPDVTRRANSVHGVLGHRCPARWARCNRTPAVSFGHTVGGSDGSERVLVHDFVVPELGRAIPYGVYDVGQHVGWVNVGIDHDTASFAVESIRRWWQHMGQSRYPMATRLLVMADAGGSNGPGIRLWRVALQHLADQLQLPIHRLPFSTGHEQMEQDRASALLVHQYELARETAPQLSGHRQSHRRHDDAGGIAGRSGRRSP
jgi:hypothetical protein